MNQIKKLLKKHADKLRFGIVGLANTAIDFTILFALFDLAHLPSLLSNIISTSVALTFSFFMNKSFTFRDKSKAVFVQFALFLVITLFGLWGLQNLVIYGTENLVGPLIGNDSITLFIGKVLATCVSLVWNYIMYSRFVFKKQSPKGK